MGGEMARRGRRLVPLALSDAEREMLCWRTLTFAPIDRRLIVAERLTGDERDWLNG